MSAPPEPTSPPVKVGVKGTRAKLAKKLVAYGWWPEDAGWTNGLMDMPVSADEAAAMVLQDQPDGAGGGWQAVMKHFAGSVNGTISISGLTAIVAYAAANPPPDMALSPQTAALVKYAVGLAVAVLGGKQLVSSMKQK